MSEKACSAVEIVFPPGVFMTMMPRFVAASTSTLSTPTPARPMTFSLCRGLDDLRRRLRLAAHHERVKFADDREQFVRLQPDLDRDIEQPARGEFIDAALGDGIGDEDFRFGHGVGKKERDSRQRRAKRKGKSPRAAQPAPPASGRRGDVVRTRRADRLPRLHRRVHREQVENLRRKRRRQRLIILERQLRQFAAPLSAQRHRLPDHLVRLPERHARITR